MKVLLVNSDLAVNRGDRAIAEGIIALVHRHLPGARITAISQHPERDAEWLGVDILPQGVHSLNPVDAVRFLRAARRSDIVLWGGGELLKDYTNRLGLWYWAVKMIAASIVAPSVVGVFQGIGPTRARSSKWLIARVVSRTQWFLVRDAESRDKLCAWGVDPARVIATYDSAIASVPDPSPLPVDALAADGIDEEFLSDFVAIAPRDWFHYRQGGFIPHRWRRSRQEDPRHETYLASVVAVLDELAQTHRAVLLVPMHVSEDVELCRALHARMHQPERARVLAHDLISPMHVRHVLGRARLMVALRLHAGIVATSMGVPTLTYYYVDKGRLYADQVGMSKFAVPIEDLVEENALDRFIARRDSLVGDRTAVAQMNARLDQMRAHVDTSFATALRDHV